MSLEFVANRGIAEVAVGNDGVGIAGCYRKLLQPGSFVNGIGRAERGLDMNNL